MAEEVTKYVVSVGFDDALKNVNRFINKMSKMEQGREAALSRQIKLQKQLNNLRGRGGGGGSSSTTRASPTTSETSVARKPPAASKRGRAGLEGGFFDLGLEKKQNKAAKSLFADMLREEEEAAKKVQKVEDARLKTLDKQLTNARRVVNVLNMETDAASKSAALAIKEKIAKAQTADEVRDIVAQERKRLQLAKRQTKQAEKQNFLLRRMRSSSEQVAGNMASAFAVGAAGAFITKTGQDFESVNNTMLAVSENSKEATENFEFVREEAFRLGMGLTQSAKGFAKLRAAQGDMSLEDTRTAFTGISEMSSLLGLTAEESSRSLNALGQMMSKGSVSAEELSN